MKQLLLVVLGIVVMISCGRKSESESRDDQQSRAFALERENFFNSLKKPDEVASLALGQSGFDANLLHDTSRYYHYMDNHVKAAANLGIYISDLNYCILFKQREESKKYFQVAYKLSDAMQIEKSILTFLMIRYEKNIDQNDSLKAVVSQLFSQSTSGLQGTDRERLAGLAMAGYQIENLYLALATLKSLPEVPTEEQAETKKQLMQFVLEQRGKFEVIYNFVRANSDPLDPDNNPDYPFFDNALRELIVAYRTFTMSDSSVIELHDKVSVIREKLIS